MGLRADWVSAKKQSAAQFKKAYAAWVKDARTRIEQGEDDPELRAVAMQDNLEKAGLEGGVTFDDVVRFKKDLGPALDKYEKARKPYDDFKVLPYTMKLEKIAKNSTLSKAFEAHCKRRNCEQYWLYYTKGHKLKPEKIYDEYIAKGGKMKLKLPSSRKKEWEDWKTKGKGDGKRLAWESVADVQRHLVNGPALNFEDDNALKKALGLDKAGKMGQQIEKVCLDYRGKLQALQQRWQSANLSPKFWEPTMEALDRIMKTVKA